MMEQRLTLILTLEERSTDGHLLGLFRCKCGGTATAIISRVRNGYTRSCGCLSKEVDNTTHGMRNDPAYSSWQSMKARCLNKQNKDYPRWGGKGITVCDEWIDSFESFYAHIGPRPPGTSIDRIDGSRGYEPGNVRWATPAQQARNRRDLVVLSTPVGVMPLVDYAKRLGISKGAAHLRLKRGQLDGCSHV